MVSLYCSTTMQSSLHQSLGSLDTKAVAIPMFDFYVQSRISIIIKQTENSRHAGI